GVQAAQVLDIALFTDLDPFTVGPDHRAVPDARRAADGDLAHHDGAGGDVGVRVDLRDRPVVQCSDVHLAHRNCRFSPPGSGIPVAGVGRWQESRLLTSGRQTLTIRSFPRLTLTYR